MRVNAPSPWLARPYAKLVSLLGILLSAILPGWALGAPQKGQSARPLLFGGDGIRWHPMTFKEAAVKFRGCAEEWSKAKKEGIIGFVRSLDLAGDMSALAPFAAVEKR